MIETLSVYDLTRDPRVRFIVFVKLDSNNNKVVQRMSCDELKQCGEDNIELKDNIFIARWLKGGIIDYPYIADNLAIRLTTSLELYSIGTQEPVPSLSLVARVEEECSAERLPDQSPCNGVMDPPRCTEPEYSRDGSEVSYCWEYFGTGQPECVKRTCRWIFL